ncbi:hypothetical protein Salmuc_02095 [Salipiger mucosus DSM 16094]|uniref:Phasin domain-containing protein n=2 Tax=Salipiger mucosus TaxID=263378 RepID=S9QV94_9RHOB|nr:hypothetical protein Salmuc_02095 [Salipiger mucosus DSM 16094]
MNQDHLGFLNKRLDRDRALFADLSGLRNPIEVVSDWAKFYRTTQEEYAEEFNRLMGLFADGTRETTAEIQHDLEEAAAVATKALPDSEGSSRTEAA